MSVAEAVEVLPEELLLSATVDALLALLVALMTSETVVPPEPVAHPTMVSASDKAATELSALFRNERFMSILSEFIIGLSAIYFCLSEGI